MEPEANELYLNEAGMAASPAGSVLDLVEGELQRPKLSLLYQLSLVVVSLAMVLLPLVYVALVGLFGYGVYYYTTHFHPHFVWQHGGRLAILAFAAYLTPIVAGVVLLFFFVKPIFAPRDVQEEHYSLNTADAPQLFALIGWICRSLNAPIPSRIDVNLLPNASAGFRSGLRSLFGNDIVLTIGLPLVAGMNLSQFAGVIAHEYGHFSQGTAMRASYLIRRINHWFARVVYQRDAWDVLLMEMSEESGSAAIMLVFLVARLGVWIGRSILWVLMVVGAALSSLLERQMEFDADAYEVQMSGTETFISTSRRLRQLDLGTAAAMAQFGAKWKQERKLFDNLPDFLVSRANEVAAANQHHYLVESLQRKTRLFDSHPSDAERILRAREANLPGVFRSTEPATTLFANFTEFSRRVTLEHYQNAFGEKFSPEWLVSVESTARAAEHDYAADRENVNRYFLGLTTSLRPLILSESKGLAFRSRETTVAEFERTRQQMQELAPPTRTALDAFKQADARWLQTVQANALLEAAFAFNPADFGVTDSEIAAAVESARRAVEAAGAGLQAFEEAGKERLASAIQLLRLPDVARAVPDAVKLQDRAKELLWTFSRLGEVFGPLLEIRRDCAALEVILQYRDSGQRGENLTAATVRLGNEIQGRVGRIQQLTGQMLYPFPHASGQLTISEYARNTEYQPDPARLVLLEGRSHTEKLIALYYRLLSELVSIAEKAEKNF